MDVASDLFYSKGYVNTGVEEIITHCNVKKPTLYYYYESKVALGLAYLSHKENEFLGILDRLGEKSPSLQDFFIGWTNLIRRMASHKTYHGCPFGSFASQLSDKDRPDFESKLRTIKKRWLEKVSSVLRKHCPKTDESVIQKTAMETMVIYEGAANLYRMTGEVVFIQSMKDQFLKIVKNILPQEGIPKERILKDRIHKEDS